MRAKDLQVGNARTKGTVPSRVMPYSWHGFTTRANGLAIEANINSPGEKRRSYGLETRAPKMLLTAAAYSLLLFCTLCPADAPSSAAAYSNDFEKASLGKPPEDLLLLNGVFNVVNVDGNKSLELDADPIDGDGFLFGPPGMTTGTVSAKIWSASTGRRFPEFGIGAGDAGGWKLIVVPALGTLELRKGDDAKATAPFTWKSETWTRLRLHIVKTPDGKFVIEGKAWPDGAAEPQAWNITTQDTVAPPAGRASAWGMPYSEKSMRFDDLGFDPK